MQKGSVTSLLRPLKMAPGTLQLVAAASVKAVRSAVPHFPCGARAMAGNSRKSRIFGLELVHTDTHRWNLHRIAKRSLRILQDFHNRLGAGLIR